MNRRMPNGTYGGVRGWGREAPAYSMLKWKDDVLACRQLDVLKICRL